MMAQFFPYMFIALIAIMMVFLATKGRASTVMLYVAVVVQGAVVVAANAVAATAGFGVMFVIFSYIIPAILMLNFALCAVVFNDIAGGLKGKLKLLTGTSLASYGIITCAVYFERQLFNWIERIFTFWESKFVYDLLFGLPMVLWVLGGLVAHWGMFIYALKTARERTRKIWIVVAFLCPIVGSVIYLFVQLVRGLLGTRRRT